MSDQGPYPGAPGPFNQPGGGNPYNPPGGGNPYNQPPGPQGQPGYPPPGGQPNYPPNPQQGGQPYPAGGQQYGQPGQPYGGGQPPYGGGVPQFGGSNYNTPPPKKKKTIWIVIGSLVALVVAAVVALVVVGVVLADDISDVKAGDCVTVTGSNSDADFDKVDCGDTGSLNFYVADKLDTTDGSCGGEQYSELTQTGDETTKLCLVPNFEEGKCYEIPISSLTGMKEVACGAGDSSQLNRTVKVTARVDSVNVPDCDDPVTFDKPKPLGYCLGDPTE
ncbi:hypothetical protein [Williamsia sp. 1138]|uniref:LppU/SCO3897 family protein n=1 Tax=Williamsia sp. 1138 TaxID=1903117 RepID=UPI000A23D838|nr:hypothetical protein [Williamsia sp. 1138]